MTEALGIVGAATGGVGVLAVVAFAAYALRTVREAQRGELGAQRSVSEQIAARHAAEDQRDDALRAQKVAERRVFDLEVQAKSLHVAQAQMQQKIADLERERIIHASPTDLPAVVDGVLSRPLPGAPGSAKP